MDYLLLTEGEKTEQNILYEVLRRYGFNVLVSKKIERYDDLDIDLDISNIQKEKKNIIIAQAPRNRLKDLLKYYKDNLYDLDMVFTAKANSLAGIFLIFDVDHTSDKDLKEIFSIHNDETSNGLLLVSSPCIEVLSEPNRTKPLFANHLSEYKKARNAYFNDEIKMGINCEKYIIDNFEELAIKFLEKNRTEFGCDNVMEHPYLVIDKINRENIRTEREVQYRYFTTVVYVALAYILGLTKQENNCFELKDYLLNKI